MLVIISDNRRTDGHNDVRIIAEHKNKNYWYGCHKLFRTHGQTDRQTDRHKDRHTQRNRQTERQTNEHTDRQTDRQTKIIESYAHKQ